MSGGPAARLFCFHHAGAGVSCFAAWQRVFGAAVEVVPVLLPGRDTRAREPRITGAEQLVAELTARLGPLLDRPYAFYGHSLGGMVAYTLARALEEAGAPGPDAVAVGALPPPHLPSPLLPERLPPDAELLPWLVARGVLPPVAAAAEGGMWRRRVLPTLRDDLLLARALRARADSALSCPMLAVAGRADTIAPAPLVARWRRYAPAGFRFLTLPGGHFFVRDPALPALLRDVLPGLVRTVRPESSST